MSDKSERYFNAIFYTLGVFALVRGESPVLVFAGGVTVFCLIVRVLGAIDGGKDE